MKHHYLSRVLLIFNGNYYDFETVKLIPRRQEYYIKKTKAITVYKCNLPSPELCALPSFQNKPLESKNVGDNVPQRKNIL